MENTKGSSNDRYGWEDCWDLRI